MEKGEWQNLYPPARGLRIQSERDVRLRACGFSQSERSALTFIRFDVCVFFSLFSFLTLPAMGQAPPAQPPQTAEPSQNAQPPQTAQAPAVPTAAPGPQKSVPDYPDPRTLTLGISYWATGPGTEPSLYTGRQALDFETLTNLGKPRRTPGVEASLPITRTGELRLEVFQTKGDGNQKAPGATDVFATANYSPGDYLATQYQVKGAKLYLDDLLFPHKFPVSKFRVKSLWEVAWVSIKGTTDAPYLDATGVSASASGSRQIIFPEFGLAAEYAIAPHVLLRAAGAGFGLYHKADLWDAEATIAFRRGAWEIRGGGKAFHFKTSPNNTEFMTATFTGAFVGLRWHWSL
jgi:hypothetical protein